MKENMNDDLEEFKDFIPSKAKERLMIAGVIILGLAIFFGVIFGSLYIAKDATNAVTQGLGISLPIK
jgi:hypothetical protein